MKKHFTLRMIVMLLFFISGLSLVWIGWSMTGALAGLGWMLLGIVLLLTTLLLYNKRYQ